MEVQAVNAVNKTKLARSMMDGALGLHREAWMPELATRRLRWSAAKTGSATTAVAGKLAPGKVAVFATCFINYNEPGIGHDLLKVLEHNRVPCVLVEKGPAAACPSSSSVT